MTLLDTKAPVLLTDDMLARFDERAATYDRENRFFQEDFEELAESGYLLAAVPESYGGAGLALAEVMRLQQRLAYHAPATAIAINMHLYWTGVAADLLRFGDDRMAWILQEAADGNVFAAGHGERATMPASSPRPPWPSASKAAGRSPAARCSAACRPCGPTSASTPWTSATPRPSGDPRLPARDTPGYHIEADLGRAGDAGDRQPRHRPRRRLRARRADARRHAGRVRGRRAVPPRHPGLGAARVANVYTGVARRAYDLTVAQVTSRRTSGSPARWRTTLRCSTRWPTCACRSRPSTPTSGGSATTGPHGVDHGADWGAQDHGGQALRREPGLVGRRHRLRRRRRLGGSSSAAAWSRSSATRASDGSIPPTVRPPTRSSPSSPSASTPTSSPAGVELGPETLPPPDNPSLPAQPPAPPAPSRPPARTKECQP